MLDGSSVASLLLGSGSRRFLAAGLLLALPPLAWAEDGAPLTFQKAYSGSHGSPYAVHPAPDGGYILTGAVSFVGEDDVYLLKTDALGGFEWERSFGDPGYGGDVGRAVEPTSDGGYIIAAATDSDLIPPSMGIYLIKVDGEGRLIWERTYGGMYCQSVRETDDGGYIALGTTPGDDLSHIDNDTNWDVYLVRVDSQGNLLWNNAYDRAKNDYAVSLELTPDGGCILAAQTYGDDGRSDTWIIRTNAEGTVLWEKVLDSGRSDTFCGVAPLAGGGFMTVISTEEWQAESYLYAVELDDLGELLWAKRLDRAAQVRSVEATDDGGVAVAGSTFADGGAAAMLLRIDADGARLWDQTYAGTGHAQSMHRTEDGGYIIASGVLIKTDSLGRSARPWQLPGDSNGDGDLDISDGIRVLRYLFGGETLLPCGDGSLGDPGNLSLVDFNGDSQVDVSDCVSTFTRLFLGGPPHAMGTECISLFHCPDLCKN